MRQAPRFFGAQILMREAAVFTAHIGSGLCENILIEAAKLIT